MPNQWEKHSPQLLSTPRHGNTPLAAALQNSEWEVAKILIDLRADVCKPNREGMTAWHHAAKGDNAEVIKLLLDASADPTVKLKSDQGPVDVARAAAEEKRASNEAPESPQSHPTLSVLGVKQ